MPSFPSHVTDDMGARHHLADVPLGAGGQGAVFRTLSSPGLVVKLLPRRRTDLRERLALVRTLPLADDLPIARPLAALQDRTGYTMTLMTDMAPIRSLIYTPAAGPLPEFYVRTGGLRRRLRVLARAAATLTRLHAIPVVYVDLSDNNVFVSDDPEHEEVWFIDADNLDYDTGRQPPLYTPGYGAPEVVAGDSPTTLSDAYAFAILAFQVLAQHHPFLGPRAEAGGWDDDGEDGEALAFSGALPWILDPDDPSNASDLGIRPVDLVLSAGLRDLFQATFGPGRRDRTRRPGMATWTEALARAADRTVSCPVCQSTFYLAPQCPWCEGGDRTRPSFLAVVAGRWDPLVDDPADPPPPFSKIWRLDIDLRNGGGRVIPRHVTRPTLFVESEVPALSIEPNRDGLLLSPQDDLPYTVARRNGDLVALSGPVQLPLPVPGKEWSVHCGPLDTPHRALSVSAHLAP